MMRIFSWLLFIAVCLSPAMGWAACQGVSCVNTDSSSASPSLSGLTLLATIASTPNRRGYVVQAQDSAANCSTGGGANGLIVALDDAAGGTVTVLILAYASAKGGQGSAVDMQGLPHTGRLRIYGAAGCQVGAAQW